MMPESDLQYPPQQAAELQLPASQWRWLSLALVILTLLAYPLMRLIHPDNTAAASALLFESFQDYQAKRFPEAIATANRILEINPNSADAYNNLAITYAAMDQWELAIHSAQTALRIDPNHELARNNLAWILWRRDAAAGAASKASTKSSDAEKTASEPRFTPTAAMLQASTQLYQAGRYKEAIDVAREVLKRDPQSADAYNNLAISYEAIGQWDQAFANALAAVRISPDFQLAKNNLAWMIQQRDAPPSTAGLNADATPEFYLSKSLLEYRAGNYEASLASAKNAARLRWNYAEAYNNMAAANMELKRYDDAIDAAYLAVALRPDFQLAENNLNWAREQKKKAGKQ